MRIASVCVCAAQRVACAELVRSEGALAVLAHSQAALGCSTVLIRMAVMVTAGGAVRHTGSCDGPDLAEKPTCFADGSNLHYATFPWELTNTDYIRRVLAQVGYALQPLVKDIVKDEGKVEYAQHKVQKVFVWCDNNNKFEVAVEKTWDDKNKKFEEVDTNATLANKVAAATVVFQSQDPNGVIGCDPFYLMKHILFTREGKTPTCHTTFYVDQMKAAGVLNLEVDDLKTRLSRLIECRNQLAHMSLTSNKNWLDGKRMESIFADALFVVTCAGEYLKIKNGLKENYAKENMERLKEQWETHTESRHRRKNAMRLFVGNVPDDAMEQDLKVILKDLMKAKKYCTEDESPVVQCKFKEKKQKKKQRGLLAAAGKALKNLKAASRKKAAFVDFRSVEWANNCLSLNGSLARLANGQSSYLKIQPYKPKK